jgi:hypothetical protein
MLFGKAIKLFHLKIILKEKEKNYEKKDISNVDCNFNVFNSYVSKRIRCHIYEAKTAYGCCENYG